MGFDGCSVRDSYDNEGGWGKHAPYFLIERRDKHDPISQAMTLLTSSPTFALVVGDTGIEGIEPNEQLKHTESRSSCMSDLVTSSGNEDAYSGDIDSSKSTSQSCCRCQVGRTGR